MACACGKSKTSSTVYVHTVNGSTTKYPTETEAKAAAQRLGGTVTKQ